MARKLVIIGGNRPQLRKASAKNWTKAKEERFVAVLADTCNVTRACKAAKVGVTSVYRRKKENAAFRAGWLAAIAIAYERLELVLLERAFNGTEKKVTTRGGDTTTMREYSNSLAVTLLKMHRDTAADASYDAGQDEIEEVRERILRKLQRMKSRDAGMDGAES